MKEKKKGMSPILIVVLSIIGICLVGFCTWYGVNYFKGEEKLNSSVDESSNVEEKNVIISCGGKSFIVSNDSKKKIPETSSGTGWTGGSAGIYFYLKNDKSLTYETWLERCDEYDDSASDVSDACLKFKIEKSNIIDTGYKCDYLFENDDTLAIDTEDPIPYGFCYSNGKYYELGLRELSGNTTDVNSWKPYIEDITEYCKTN